jgi:hypothetical protein
VTATYNRLEGAIRAGWQDVVRATVVGLLNDIITERLPVAAVCHPLGFVCFPVLRHGADGICVHAWYPEPDSAPKVAPVHCHSWDLLSSVLHGSVRNQLVDLVDAPMSAQHRVFTVASGPDGDVLTATPRQVRCRLHEEESYRAGQAYQVAAGEFHRTLPPSDLAVTVVLGRQRSGVVDRVLREQHLAPSGTTRRDLHSLQESRRIAADIIDRLPAPVPESARWPVDARFG